MRENDGRIPYKYKPGGYVLIRHDAEGATFKGKMTTPTEGPYKITRVIGNHTLELKKGRYLEKINIRRVQPFHGKIKPPGKAKAKPGRPKKPSPPAAKPKPKPRPQTRSKTKPGPKAGPKSKPRPKAAPKAKPKVRSKPHQQPIHPVRTRTTRSGRDY
jgi:hypothetical protein